MGGPMRAVLALLVSASVFSFVPARARASGFEFPENGSLPMGRGGAFVARASDPSALMNNVAGIAALPGRFQLSLSGNFFFLGHCFQRDGIYQGFDQNVSIERMGTLFSSGDYEGARYPQVCNQNPIFPAPQLLATVRVHEMVTIGFGVYGPNAVGRQNFPDRVMVTNPMGMSVLAPSPIRNMLLASNLLILHPTLAVAVRPVHWLRIGAAIQPSFGHFQFTTIANAVTNAAQSPDQDVSTTVDASGFFMAGNFGLQIVPSPYISFGVHVHVNGQPTASGTGTACYPYYASTTPCDMRTPAPSQFTVEQMQVPLPQQFRFGVRFVAPRPLHVTQSDVHPAQPYDPMRDDLFDVELNLIYETSSAFDALRLRNSGNIQLGATQAPAPRELSVPHNWSNVFGARIGSDVNIVPNRFTVRGGFSVESAAQSRAFTHVDIPSYASIGMHLGTSLRLGFLTISIAYAHFFMSGMDNRALGAGDMTAGSLTTIGTTGALTASNCAVPSTGSGACEVNRGQFSAWNNVLHVGLNGAW